MSGTTSVAVPALTMIKQTYVCGYCEDKYMSAGEYGLCHDCRDFSVGLDRDNDPLCWVTVLDRDRETKEKP